MDQIVIKERLRENPSLILSILEHLNLDPITDKDKYFQFPNIDGDNNSACCIYKNTLIYQNYTRSKRGDIITLVMDMRNVSFPCALKLISEWIGYKARDEKIVRPFGGFYRGLGNSSRLLDTDLKVYDKSVLPPNACNLRFFKDGISYKTQERFDLRFDHENNAILIPIYNINQQLVGCKARRNEDVESNKYWAELPFAKSSVVYGLSQNYKDIVKKSKVIIFEAEKSVMQCADFDCNIATAIMGHDISEAQATIIKSLMCDEIIVAFDEGVSLCEIKKACSQLAVDNAVYHNKVFYIWGGLPKGSKLSPSDLGIDKFKKLVREQLYEYKE